MGIAPVVTLSAAYGAGGSLIGPRVAEALAVPFLDRAIPNQVSRTLSVPLDEALARDDRAEHGIASLLTSLARIPAVEYAGAAGGALMDDRSFTLAAEKAIATQTRDGAVVLGRASALVLADRPGALHVRLDGPEDSRLRQAMRILSIDEEEAREQLRDADRARDAYVRHFYHCDATDPSHYHLVLDSTALDLDTCAELIVSAARARLRASG